MPAPFDGQTFHNLPRRPLRGLGSVLRWKSSSRPAPWPSWVEDPVAPPLPPCGPGQMVVTFINHATLLIQTSEGNVLTDPVFSRRVSPVSWAGPARVRRPGLALEALPPIHGVLLSHNHYDHLDLPSLRELRRRWNPWVVTPLGVGRHLRPLGLDRVHELDWWETAQGVTCTPAQHFSGRGLFDRNRTLWGGLVLRGGGHTLYFAGDTGYGPFFTEIRERLGAPDLALLPIGAYDPRWFMAAVHMDPAEAVQAHLDLGARRSLGIHWGTWQLTDEPLEEPPRLLAETLAARGLDPEAFQVLAHGGSLVLGEAPPQAPAGPGQQGQGQGATGETAKLTLAAAPGQGDADLAG